MMQLGIKLQKSFLQTLQKVGEIQVLRLPLKGTAVVACNCLPLLSRDSCCLRAQQQRFQRFLGTLKSAAGFLLCVPGKSGDV